MTTVYYVCGERMKNDYADASAGMDQGVVGDQVGDHLVTFGMMMTQTILYDDLCNYLLMRRDNKR